LQVVNKNEAEGAFRRDAPGALGEEDHGHLDHGTTWCRVKTQPHLPERGKEGKAKQGKARQDKARQGKTRQGKGTGCKAGQEKARRGEAGQVPPQTVEGSRGQELCLACSWGSQLQKPGFKEYVKHKLFRKQTRVSRSQEQSPPSGWSTREKVDCKSHHMLQTLGTKASGILLNFQKKNFLQCLLFLSPSSQATFLQTLPGARLTPSSPWGFRDGQPGFAALVPPRRSWLTAACHWQLLLQPGAHGAKQGENGGIQGGSRTTWTPFHDPWLYHPHRPSATLPKELCPGMRGGEAGRAGGLGGSPPGSGAPRPPHLPRSLCIRGQCGNTEQPALCFGASRRRAADA